MRFRGNGTKMVLDLPRWHGQKIVKKNVFKWPQNGPRSLRDHFGASQHHFLYFFDNLLTMSSRMAENHHFTIFPYLSCRGQRTHKSQEIMSDQRRLGDQRRHGLRLSWEVWEDGLFVHVPCIPRGG